MFIDHSKRGHVPREPRPRVSTRVRDGIATIAAIASFASFASLIGVAGCASTGGVVAADKPGTFTVAASATGGRMAWARAHQHAIDEARDYCDRRGLQSRVTAETVSGVQMMTEHGSSINFECHPKF